MSGRFYRSLAWCLAVAACGIPSIAAAAVGVGAAPEPGSEVLFDGTRQMLDEKWTYWEGPRFSSSLPIKWPIVDDPVDDGTVLKSEDAAAAGGKYGTADIVTKKKYRDFRLHVEFLVMKPGGNSGVYLQNRYEIQILDGDKTKHGMGAVINETESPYGAYNGVGKWNAYDMVFRAARFQDGKLSEKPLVTIVFNGQKVHTNQVINKVWGGPNSGLDGGNDGGRGITDVPGGLKLQCEGHDVRYRNIWIKELDLQDADTDFAETDKPVHVLILSGQSNMVGMKTDLGLQPEIDNLFPEADVVYFKVAQGGQPIRFWVEQWDAIARKHEIDVDAVRGKEKTRGTIYYEPILQQYGALLEQHPNPTSVTFCWMQGERDARGGLSAAYADAFRQLIDNLRRDLKQPQMNFVIGRLSDFGKPDDAHWQKVRETQVDSASSDPRGAWVDCDDLNNKQKDGVEHDDLHYTKEGYELLGRRFVRQAKALIEGDTPANDGRPD